MEYLGVRKLDVSATLDEAKGMVSVYVVNRDLDGPREVEVSIVPARPRSEVTIHTISGAGPGDRNTFADRDRVRTTTETRVYGPGPTYTTELPAHSVTALIFEMS
jgi:alpha-L-arabinofuranosidase